MLPALLSLYEICSGRYWIVIAYTPHCSNVPSGQFFTITTLSLLNQKKKNSAPSRWGGRPPLKIIKPCRRLGAVMGSIILLIRVTDRIASDSRKRIFQRRMEWVKSFEPGFLLKAICWQDLIRRFVERDIRTVPKPSAISFATIW